MNRRKFILSAIGILTAKPLTAMAKRLAPVTAKPNRYGYLDGPRTIRPITLRPTKLIFIDPEWEAAAELELFKYNMREMGRRMAEHHDRILMDVLTGRRR
jgi:hypothetical protein